MTYRAPKGTDDVLPPDSRAWVLAERVFLDFAERYGYEMTLTPLFESTDLFARGVGEATEVVEKQMYTFVDKGGRSVTLRPEATASVVRALIQDGGIRGVFKGAYWGPMFRYERPQKGRRRQFYQAGVEYLGEVSPEADVEVIEFGFRYLEALDLPEVEVLLNSIGTPEDRAQYREDLISYLESRSDRLSPEARDRMHANPLRVLDSKADVDVVADAPTPLDRLGAESAAHFAEVRRGLERHGIPYRIEPRLVRGLDYYNGSVWEYVPGHFAAAQSSVGGGGRYDGLFELLGGTPTPGVGLALGIDRILLARGDRAVGPALDVFVIVADPARRTAALDLVARLRRAGVRCDTDLGTRPVKGQFRMADRRDARYAVVVGDEWEQGAVTARDLASGDQGIVEIEEIESWVMGR